MFEVAESIRNTVPPSARADMMVSEVDMSAAGMASDIEIAVRGDDLEALENMTEQVAQTIGEVEGIREVETSFDDPIPQVTVDVDHQRAQVYGLTSYQIGDYINNVTGSQTISFYREQGHEYDMAVSLAYSHQIDIPANPKSFNSYTYW